jgi:uncharacterized protein (DUF1499 family)
VGDISSFVLGLGDVRLAGPCAVRPPCTSSTGSQVRERKKKIASKAQSDFKRRKLKVSWAVLC